MLALADGEFVQADRGCGKNFDIHDGGSGWRLGFQVLNKRLQSGLSAFDENLNASLAVQHPSGESIGTSETINEGTETNPLHNPANSNGTGAGHRYSTSTVQLRPCQPI
jgi:hypothetical protein